MNTGKNLRLDKNALETVHEKVLRALREAIIRGDFTPGDRLVQDELADSLGVSRMPVREALRKLEIEGFIEMEPHRGAVVKILQHEDIAEVYALRAVLEKMAVEHSVVSIRPEQIERLEELHTLMEKTTNTGVFVKANIEFHQILRCHCPWKRLLSFIDTLWNGLPQQTPHILMDQARKSNQDHKEMIEAVKRKDGIHAGEILARHISRTGKELIKETRSKIR